MKFQNFQKQTSDLKSAPSKQDTGKNSLRLKVNNFSPKTPKFRNLGSKFSKTNVTFEFSTFEIAYMQNFFEIRKLILFGPKCLTLCIWTQNLKNESQQNFPGFPNFDIFGRFVILARSRF